MSREDIVEIEICGNRFKIRQPAGEIDVRDVAEFFDAKIKSVAETAPTASSLNHLILAGLNICAELFELKNKNMAANRTAEGKLDGILQNIETMQY